jgi:hypothetical protein
MSGSWKCPRCGSYPNDEPGLCYSCKVKDYLDGKCDSWGHPLFTEVSNKRLRELEEIERKYNSKIK